MTGKMIFATLLAAGALACGGALAQTPAPAPGPAPAPAAAPAAPMPPMTLTSTSFKDGAMMDKKHANNSPANPNCVGQNISPQLSWTGTPPGTKSFVLTMVDPEGRGGAGVHHWVAYGIPADINGFAEGETSKESPKYVGGKSTQGVGHYSGPCTPPGTPHHYTFVIIGTDFEPKELAPGLTLPEVWAKLPGRGKNAAGLVGMFVKP